MELRWNVKEHWELFGEIEDLGEQRFGQVKILWAKIDLWICVGLIAQLSILIKSCSIIIITSIDVSSKLN